LVGELLEMTELDVTKAAETQLAPYVPQAYRK
jgi:hypothetical protein